MEYIKKGTNLKEELSQLEILKVLEKNPNFKQRDISNVTGINLFKVNFLIKKMLEKGYLKCKNVYKNPNKLSYLYWLTPEGFSRKSKLIYRFVKVTLDNYDTYVNMLLHNLIELQNQKNKKIIIIGDDTAIQIFQNISNPFNFEIIGITSLNKKNSSKSNLKYIPLEKVNGFKYDKIILLTIQSQEELDKYINEKKIEEDKLYYLN